MSFALFILLEFPHVNVVHLIVSENLGSCLMYLFCVTGIFSQI